MLFNSFAFVFLFFPIVTVLYYVASKNARIYLLIAASCYFYMAFVPKYILILVFLIIVDYFAGLFIERSAGRKRRAFLVASLLANIGALAVFKYFNFVNTNLGSLAGALHVPYPIHNLSIILPIGLSFHTFQSMSYTIEVFRGKQKAERNFPVYALYVLFYPQLDAGPIERPQNLLHQFHTKQRIDYGAVVAGLQLMVWGFFKKMFVADRLAALVDDVYNAPHRFDGWSFPYLLATYAFTFQIYCDFSGYSDIARGAAKVMGYDLMVNFDHPYIAKSIREFWRRWHISLSTWFKDYLYKPLILRARDDEGNVTQRQLHLFVLIVFLTSGFWHGAGWSFGLWGLSHGLFIIASDLLSPVRSSIHRALGVARFPRLVSVYRNVVMFHLVVFTWILFRASSLGDAGHVMRQIAVGRLDLARAWHEYGHLPDLQVGAFGLAVLLALEALHRSPAWKRFETAPAARPLRSLYYAMLIVITCLGAPLVERAFVYFQF